MILIFIGPPGAGKGTQAKILEDRFAHRQISTGDLLRGHRARKTPLGLEAQAFMDRGALVPDDVIIRMMANELVDAGDVIVDGFPRTVAQAEAFDDILRTKGDRATAVVFDVDQAVLKNRIVGRWTNPRTGRVYHATFSPPQHAGIDDEDGGPLIQRPDDTPEIVDTRLGEYNANTAPLVAYYGRAGNCVHVDALQDIDEVTRQIVASLPGLSVSAA